MAECWILAYHGRRQCTTVVCEFLHQVAVILQNYVAHCWHIMRPIASCYKISRLESWPDHQGLAGGLYDLFRDCLQLVDLQEALDFGAEAVQQAKVAAGVADNRRDRLSIGKIPIWVNDPQLRPLARQDVPRLVRS